VTGAPAKDGAARTLFNGDFFLTLLRLFLGVGEREEHRKIEVTPTQRETPILFLR